MYIGYDIEGIIDQLAVKAQMFVQPASEIQCLLGLIIDSRRGGGGIGNVSITKNHLPFARSYTIPDTTPVMYATARQWLQML